MSNHVLLYTERADAENNNLWVYAHPEDKSNLAIQEVLELLEKYTVKGANVQKSVTPSGKIVVACIPVYGHNTAAAIQTTAAHLLDRLPEAEFGYSQDGHLNSWKPSPHYPELCESVPAIQGMERILSKESISEYLDAFYESITRHNAMSMH